MHRFFFYFHQTKQIMIYWSGAQGHETVIMPSGFINEVNDGHATNLRLVVYAIGLHHWQVMQLVLVNNNHL